jgi:hypothetical protein
VSWEEFVHFWEYWRKAQIELKQKLVSAAQQSTGSG